MLGLFGLRCEAMMQREPTLDEAAVLMYEFPDSAMALVEKVEPRLAAVEHAEEEKADSVANTVFNYYRKHGSRREKFDIYYILGRYHQLRGNEEVAMFCYVSADQYAGDAADPVLPGCLYSSMASLFEYGFDYAKAGEYYSRSGDCFFDGRNYGYYTEAGIRAARCYFYLGDEEKARALVDEIEPYREYLEDSSKVRYFRLILNLEHDISPEDVISAISTLEDSGGNVRDPGGLLAVSDIYLKSGFADSAMVYLGRYREAYLEELYRNVSMERDALSNIKKNSVTIDGATRNVIENRLVVLDELLTIRRLGDYSPQKALEMIESIALDQDAYLNSLGLIFSLRHPEFAAYLRARQFTTWEIGYCSLYCMGYKGKDIGNILSSSRYYKINSEIRKKLGIGPTETNLDIYLRKKMAEFENLE